MKRTVLSTALCAALLSPLAVADDKQSGGGTSIDGLLTEKNLGRLLGAGVGALIGSQVGSGTGNVAATAAGAIAGLWLGGEAADRLAPSDHQGIARTAEAALETGQTQSWTNPDTGVTTRSVVKQEHVRPTTWSAPTQTQTASRTPPRRAGVTPPLDMVNAHFVATKTSNLRAGPGTEYEVLDTVTRGERVTAVGKVQGKSWYLITRDNSRGGFIYGSLIERSAVQPPSGNPLRAALGAPRARATEYAQCSVITQEIILPDGSRESRDIKACKNADGTWEAV